MPKNITALVDLLKQQLNADQYSNDNEKRNIQYVIIAIL